MNGFIHIRKIKKRLSKRKQINNKTKGISQMLDIQNRFSLLPDLNEFTPLMPLKISTLNGSAFANLNKCKYPSKVHEKE